ncbi:MAG TPA: hypothetical protein VHZ03_31255 [Trebonia sp.]|jgi:hypothetical protein|nr:hypothetical protein [Trebonia sp.]
MATRQQAQAALDKAAAERDTIQGNLLDLDGSFGKQLLSGASLTGESKRRWDTAAATLAALWETFSAYSAVIDQAAQLMSTVKDRDLDSVTTLLSGPSVRLSRGPAPLGRRDLADGGVDMLTVPAAVAQMRREFGGVTEVVAAAEAVWGEVGGLLGQAGTDLSRAASLAAGLSDDTLSARLAEVSTELSAQRATLNTDPLSLWQDGHADTGAASRVRDRVAAVAAEVDATAKIRDGARQRIDAMAGARATAVAAWQDALHARQRAAVKIADEFLPAVPAGYPGTAVERASLDALASAGQWQRLSAEIDRAERGLAAEIAAYRKAADDAESVLSRREELRGMLQAYKAKAARLGGAEDFGLTERYDAARELLWTAPCDLGAAADAVAVYQQAILAKGRGQG